MKTIIQVSDCHINNRENNNFIKVINKIKTYNYDAIIFTGDITKDGLLSEYLTFEFLIKDLTNTFFLAGNHDNLINMVKVFSKKQLQSFYLDDYYIQLINSKIDNKISGFIDITDIKNIPNSLIFTHHPILKMDSSWDDNLSISNMNEVQNRLNENIKMVGFGHTHEAKDFKINNTTIYSCPASSYGFNDNKIGFNIYTLVDDADDISKQTIFI